MKRDSKRADGWMTRIFSEAAADLESLPAARLDDLVTRLDLRGQRRKWSTMQLGFAGAIIALVAVGATYASLKTWGEHSVTPSQLRHQAQITITTLPPSNANREGDLLVIRLKPSQQTCIYRFWEGLLIASAYEAPPGVHVPRYRIEVGCDGGSGGIRKTTSPPLPPPTIRSATQHILDGLKSQNLVPLHITFIHTQRGHLAVAVTAQTSNPRRFPLANRGTTSLAVIGYEERYDGRYLRLVDSEKHTIWETAWSRRLQEGVGGPGPRYE